MPHSAQPHRSTLPHLCFTTNPLICLFHLVLYFVHLQLRHLMVTSFLHHSSMAFRKHKLVLAEVLYQDEVTNQLSLHRMEIFQPFLKCILVRHYTLVHQNGDRTIFLSLVSQFLFCCHLLMTDTSKYVWSLRLVHFQTIS